MVSKHKIVSFKKIQLNWTFNTHRLITSELVKLIFFLLPIFQMMNSNIKLKCKFFFIKRNYSVVGVLWILKLFISRPPFLYYDIEKKEQQKLNDKEIIRWNQIEIIIQNVFDVFHIDSKFSNWFFTFFFTVEVILTYTPITLKLLSPKML